ncbi:MAG: hypothetical protein RBU30_12750 [Polyangia bacterium]|jgi:hypothetical protein|nr:hypothetical protein [Polyangia bacterium]
MSEQVVCVSNIGPREARKRLLLGAVFFVLALALGMVLLLSGASRLTRIFLFLPLGAGALAYYQARERTCVALARRGVRNLDRGIEVVSDPAVVGASRRLANKVIIQAVVTATCATVLFLLIPT